MENRSARKESKMYNQAKPAKRKPIYTLIVCTALFVVLSLSVFAWLSNIFVITNDPFTGSSVSAYFAGGTGTKDDPYLITRREHIYNLSWLQYLGIFNQDTNGDGKIEQNYFRLENDVDMDGLIIPPIGTSENPFIGNFNGQNHVITGAIISNYVSDTEGDGGLEETPSSFEKNDMSNIGDDGTDKSIIGFFGVVGDWDDSLTGKINDDTNIEIRSKTNAVYDFRLDNLTIRSDTDESLMGLLAGYVNGSLQNVGIGQSSLVVGQDVKPLNISAVNMQSLISRYSLIGEYNENDVEWPDKPVLGGWGESIDMLGMYNRLSDIVIPQSTLVEYVSEITVTYDENGNEVSREETKTETNEIWSVDLPNGLGSYTFSSHTDGGGSANNVASYQYKYLYGNVNVTQTTIERRPTTDENKTYISSGNNYLTVTRYNNSYTVTNTTNSGNASVWELTSNGYLRTTVNNSTRYLNVNTNTLALTNATSGSTKWEKSVANGVGALTCTVDGTKYCLYFEDGEWTLKPLGTTVFYKISNGTYYLNENNGQISSGTDSDTATLWAFSDDSPSGIISANGYNLYANQSSSGSWWNTTYTYTLILNSSNSTEFTLSNDNKLYTNLQTSGGWGGDSANFYLSCSSTGTWSLQQTNGSSLTIEEFEQEITADDYQLNFPTYTYYTETSSTLPLSLCPDATWMPLLTGIDEETGEEYVLPGNTGYIVSSSDFDQNNGTLRRAGNIRVSEYSKSDNVANSLSGNALDHSAVYTRTYKGSAFGAINSIDYAKSSLGLSKYEDSSGKFNTILGQTTSNGNVYGLHFMKTGKTISTENMITIDGATVFLSDRVSHKIDNYQLPRNAITFNVAQDGYVNFFAGTYFTNNKSFFSFHHIERADDLATIISIREISLIYGKLGSDGFIDESVDYIYKYSDGTFSQGNSAPEGYEIVFDTEWITNPSPFREKYIYYFEIPVNAGEYALGSVADSDGAYLLYLDLAANGTSKIAGDAEHSIMGVNFVDDAGLSPDTDIELYPGMSASLALQPTVTTHEGATAVFNRTSKENIDYALGGNSADDFTLEFITMDSSTSTENEALLTGSSP